eukprot:TRINITY_DN12425_c1_g1_i1.p1 TRINITY_DN12425_c1_g1~~TRINITY_DN12425_c1_g1_i1.p1  ORF type:complete len:745 (-),score=83.08 TRINITY_DN12425_c1_g1_i1:215-2449(-)
MPRLVGPLGRVWLIGTDDFAFLCPCSAAVHLAWGALGIYGAPTAGPNDFWLEGLGAAVYTANNIACLLVACLDATTAAFAARGGVLQTEKRPIVVKLFVVRIWSGLLLLTMVVVSVLLEFFVGPIGSTASVLVLCTELAWHSLVVFAGWLISKDIATCGVASGITDGAVRMVMYFLGAGGRVTRDVMEVLMRLLGDVDFVPSDVAFGLVLVSLRQRNEGKGWALNDADLVDTSSETDRAALRDLGRFVAPAVGIYGCCLSMIGEAVYDGTSVISPQRALRACCRALSCRKVRRRKAGSGNFSICSCWRCRLGCCPSNSAEESDGCCCQGDLNALQRTVTEAGSGMEVVWMSWRRDSFESAPPFAVLLDETAKEVIVTIRGTFSINDCILDVACKGEEFNPTCLASPTQSGDELDAEESHDTQTGYYAHSGMLLCMRDVKARLLQRGILEELMVPGGRANGYTVVCTGHSLGAGIAVLLALELLSSEPLYDLGVSVRYVGIEPPGCVVSAPLGEQIQRLGWCSLVLAESWIPRLSIRSLEKLREQILDELVACNNPKVQILWHLSQRSITSWKRVRPLLWLCCLFRPLACLNLPCLRRRRALESAEAIKVGNAREVLELDLEKATSASSMDYYFSSPTHELASPSLRRFVDERHLKRQSCDFFAGVMRCPGKLVVLRATESQPILCGCINKDVGWTIEWGNPEEFDEILVTLGAVENHFPYIVRAVLLAALNVVPSSFHSCRISL